MSTNFYWHLGFQVYNSVKLPTGEDFEFKIDRSDPKVHIGKRSFAGIHCFGCRKKVNMKSGVCSDCDAEYSRDDKIRGAFYFSWAQDPNRVRVLCAEQADKELVEDEYGKIYTGAEFLKVLSEAIDESAEHMGKRFF